MIDRHHRVDVAAGVQRAPDCEMEALVEAGLGALLSRIHDDRSPHRPDMRRVYAAQRPVDGKVCDVEVHYVSAVPGPHYIVVVRPVSQPTDETGLRRRFTLTRQQARVALLLLDRLSDREIAQALGIAHETARNHVKIVLRKLNARSRRDVPGILEAVSRTPGASPRDATLLDGDIDRSRRSDRHAAAQLPGP